MNASLQLKVSIIRALTIVVLMASARIVTAQTLTRPTVVPERIATGIQQPEGPLWIDTLGLIFSDIKASTIYQWSPVDGMVRTYLHPSDSSNGLTLDRQGRLVLTQMGLRRIARRESNGAIAPLASTYQGKKFNSPNDIVVKSDGSIFFTDPDFNIPTGQHAELTFRGIFRLSPSGVLQLLDSTLDKPNGICFSPDEKKLYVNDSHKCQIFAWDISGDTAVMNKTLFYTIPASGYADGMKVDSAGTLYCTGPGGIWIISASGNLLSKIVMTETPSNCTWGDADRKTLYVTAGASVYRIHMSPTAVGSRCETAHPVRCELLQNYPNPFNPTTVITYQVPENGPVLVRVHDEAGREVNVLRNEQEAAGTYSLRFDASGLASGTYYYTLQEGSFTVTKKMVFLR